MLFYFSALLLAAIIVWLNNRSGETNRWAAFFLLFASIGGTTGWLSAHGAAETARLVQLLNYTLTPYGVLVFSLVYSGKLTTAAGRSKTMSLLLIPPVLIAVMEYTVQNRILFYIVLLICCAPYYLSACMLLITSFWQETDARRKRNRFITMLIIVPPLLGVLIFIYMAKVVYPDFDFFQYISVFMIYSFVLALLCTFLYGVLGVRIKFEHDPLESTMQAVGAGTSLLNHTIKNEAGKIAISTENLKSLYEELGEPARQHMQIIENATGHMLEMVARIHSQTKAVELAEESCRFDEMIEEIISRHTGLFQKHRVTVNVNMAVKPVILCDRIHVTEAVGNVLLNACEAMPEGGVIRIGLEAPGRGVDLVIEDGGPGIPQDQLQYALQPFYSSGKAGQNFGLGLSYVYNVMAKSGGSVKLASGGGEGAGAGAGGLRVTLHFPRYKVVRFR